MFSFLLNPNLTEEEMREMVLERKRMWRESMDHINEVAARIEDPMKRVEYVMQSMAITQLFTFV